MILKLVRESFDPTNNFYYNEDDEQAFKNIVPEDDSIDKNGKPINHKSLADMMINAEVLLTHEETHQMAKVIRCTINIYWNF